MRKTKGFALAVVLSLLVPCCKTDTSRPQSEQASAKGRESLAEAQGGIEPSAREAADRFLKALKVMDSPEGKKTLAETRWRQIMKFPEYQEIATLSEEMFATDIPGVRGYKRLAKLAIPRQGGRPFVKHYMLIAYKDAKKRTWKVFDFTDATNPGHEAERECAEKTLAEGDATTPQGRLMHCSYWLLMEGKIEQAEKMANKANELYAQNPNPDDEARYYKAQADATLHMISRMTGQHT